MSSKGTVTVKFRLDSKKLPALPKKKLDALRKLRDDEIDYSEIPAQINVERVHPAWSSCLSRRPGAEAPQMPHSIHRPKRPVLLPVKECHIARAV